MGQAKFVKHLDTARRRAKDNWLVYNPFFLSFFLSFLPFDMKHLVRYSTVLQVPPEGSLSVFQLQELVGLGLRSVGNISSAGRLWCGRFFESSRSQDVLLSFGFGSERLNSRYCPVRRANWRWSWSWPQLLDRLNLDIDTRRNFAFILE